MDAQKDYARLKLISKETRTLRGITALLDWDQETYMPPAAAEIRGQQLKVMAGIIHARQTGRHFAKALGKLIDLDSGKILGEGLDARQKAALVRWRRDYLLEKALPKKFVEDFAQLTSQAIMAWRQAKEQNAFQQFAPYLEKIVSMEQKKARLLGYKDHPYDALTDQYEPEMTTAEISKVFTHLRNQIVPLIEKVVNNQKTEDDFLFGDFSKEQQLAFSQILLQAMDYDMQKGRLDLSAHPFSSAGHPYDSRITTRIHPKSLMSNIMAVLHEAGHALYEMGLPVSDYGTPLCEAVSLGVHESQSRWWETRIGHSKPFWSHFLPKLKQYFPNQLEGVSLETFYRAINKVTPSFIRIEADELTYSLHVILRFELEKSLIEGSLKVKELPNAWNAKMKELLQIVPPSNKEGCLQDIHWSMGAFGYFPTYTLGNLYSAQLFEAFAKDNPQWEKEVNKGELKFIKEWLTSHVYQFGRQYNSKDLLKLITKKEFSSEPYINYLNDKYLKLI